MILPVAWWLDLKRKGSALSTRRWDFRWRWSTSAPANSGSFHKTVAVAAGLGHMGIHRNVIHPKFGNFILLGTVLVDVRISEYQHPPDYNPCVECKLCVAACPVGAISSDGAFNFSACYTHTTIASSSAGSQIGWSKSPIVRMLPTI